MNRCILLFYIGLAVLCTPVIAGSPTYVEGNNIFIETGVDPVDRSPTWYAVPRSGESVKNKSLKFASACVRYPELNPYLEEN